MRSRGFTLIELLVVVLIIALGVSIVGINVDDNSGRQLQLDARQFANNASLMVEEAVLSNRTWGVDIFRYDAEGREQIGYRWLVLSDQGEWEKPMDEVQSEEFGFAAGIGASLLIDGTQTETDIEFRQVVPTQRETDEVQRHSEREGVIDADGSIAKAPRVQPEIWMFPSGEMNAFELTLIDELSSNIAITIVGDELGRIKIVTGDDDVAQ